MAKYGILVDNEWCSGCHSCEIACQMEHNLPVGQTGIEVVTIGPWVIGEEDGGKWQYAHLPIPTAQCDSCAARRGLGKVPTCVQHCQALCLEFGPLEELEKKLANKVDQTLFVVA
ncbi:MAG: oxidoreductase [Raoultibacter sp.]